MADLKTFLFSLSAASALFLAVGCASSKPAVTETTVTQTNPDTGTTVSRTTGVASTPDKGETTTWSKETIKNR